MSTIRLIWTVPPPPPSRLGGTCPTGNPSPRGGAHVSLRQVDGKTTDGRRVYRLTFDVLAAPHQVDRVVDLVGRALCGAGEGHAGPCALAWSASHTDGESLVGAEFDRDALRALRDELAVVDVVPAEAVDRHLAR